MIHRRLSHGGVIVALALAVAGAGSATHVAPEFIAGSTNHTCDEFQGAETWTELKADPPGDGTYSDAAVTVTITNFDGKRFDWSADAGIDAVFVKAGAGGSYLYRYNPEETADTQLQSPEEQGNAISHISFCHDGDGSGGGGAGGATQSSQSSENGEVPPGSEVTDTVTVAGSEGGPTPQGTVRFFVCGPAEVQPDGCPSGAGQQVGGLKTLQGGSATSDPASPTESGRHCWRTTYSGDATYAGSTHTNGDTECFTVGQVQPGIGAVSVPNGDIEAGVEVHARATISVGANMPAATGTVTFYLCRPGEVGAGGCTAGGIQIGVAVAVSGGLAVSASTSETTQLGLYCWRAEYSGDGAYLAIAYTDRDGACFTSKLVATIGGAAVGGGAAGALGAAADVIAIASGRADVESAASLAGGVAARLAASAHVVVSASAIAELMATGAGVVADAAGQLQATGTVQFHLCVGAEITEQGCAAGGTAVGTPQPVQAGVSASELVEGLAEGRYCFRAEYSGDANHLAASYHDPATQCFDVLGSPRQAPDLPAAPARMADARRP